MYLSHASGTTVRGATAAEVREGKVRRRGGGEKDGRRMGEGRRKKRGGRGGKTEGEDPVCSEETRKKERKGWWF